jgi:diguanylate cyclase (GGDEF)-like protein
MHAADLPLAVLASALTVQVLAVLVALRFVAIGRHRLPWLLIAAALTAMALRRALPLWHHLAARPPDAALEVMDETLGLVISVLTLTGIVSFWHALRRDARADTAGMHESNLELRQRVDELERHRRDHEAHIEMSTLLQSCDSLEEAAHVVERVVPAFFPDASGSLYLEQAGGTHLSRIARWGPNAPSTVTFGREGCWAMRRGQPHVNDPASGSACCSHLQEDVADHAVCLPLRGHGTMAGLLTLRGGERLRSGAGQRQAQMLANTVGLAVVNVRLRDNLRQASIRDALTGLFNRRYLEETLVRELARAQRGSGSLSLLMVDLDHFKVVNDTYGHDVGDRVLQATAQLLERHVRAGDIACRYGGEEFAVLLPSTSPEHAVSRANELRLAMRGLALPAPASEVSLTMSVGVAAYPVHALGAAELVRASDEALYDAKRHGRDRVQMAPAPYVSTPHTV